MYTLKEMRQFLSSNGYDVEEVKKMKKSEVQSAFDSANKVMESLDNVEVVNKKDLLPSEESPIIETTTETNPNIGDPDWSDYVMKMFVPDELENGNPRVDGLRRVAFKLFGPINSNTNVVQAPDLDHGATVVVTVESVEQLRGGGWNKRSVCGAADVYSGNTSQPYCFHAVSTAETRAEGRALRKLLCLTKVMAAEELYSPTVDEPKGDDDRATTSSLMTLQAISQKVNIDLNRFCQVVFNKEKPEELTIGEVKQAVTKVLNYKQGKEQMPVEISNI